MTACFAPGYSELTEIQYSSSVQKMLSRPTHLEHSAFPVTSDLPRSRAARMTIMSGVSCTVILIAIALRLIARGKVLKKFDVGDVFVTCSLVWMETAGYS
jgi:hypothetical protein